LLLITGDRMKDPDIDAVIDILREKCSEFTVPIVTEVSRKHDPFKVLISTLISLRTKDNVTREASQKLFGIADNPAEMVKLNTGEIEKAIYPAGFYRTKAKNILKVCEILLKYKEGLVPDEIDELLELPGVGRKTANLVVTLGYGKPGICVDTHVHRISNRLGYVDTKTPDKTEFALRGKLPGQYWIEYNDLLVTYGQNLCTPVSPFCSLCRLVPYCSRVGVVKSR
jgi:endonuclease-3